MKRKFTLFLVTLAMVLVPAFAAQATIYTTESSFQAAFAGSTIVIENFEDTTLQPGLGYVTTNGYIANGLWNDRVVPGGATTTWTLEGGFFAWGGFFNLKDPGGEGTNIAVFANGEKIGEIPSYYQGGFWGFSTGIPFASVLLTAGTNPLGVQETYYSIDMRYVAAPEPATMLLLGLGLLGIGIARRKK